MELSGKVGIVTGGAEGLGLAIVEALLRCGSKVCIADIGEANGLRSANELNKKYGEGSCFFQKTDVTNEESFEKAFLKTKEILGRIDILVNNAGVLCENDWRTCINVNLNGVITGIMLALKHIGIDNGGNGGAVLNISSVGGLIALASVPVYGCTKHAVTALTRSFGHPAYLEIHGIRFSALCPGAMVTPMINKAIFRKPELLEKEKEIVSFERLPPEIVADGAIKLLKEGENGAVLAVYGDRCEYVPAQTHLGSGPFEKK